MTIEAFIAELQGSIETGQSEPLDAKMEFRKEAWWDSMAALTMLAVFDNCFNKQLSANELRECQTLEDVYRLAGVE